MRCLSRQAYATKSFVRIICSVISETRVIFDITKFRNKKERSGRSIVFILL